MSLSGGNPVGGLKNSGNSSQIAYQQDGLAVHADIECRLDGDMPRFITQVSSDVCLG